MKADVKEKLLKLAETLGDLGITIGGCGCCGSPWVNIAESDSDFDSEYFGGTISKETILKSLEGEVQ